MNEKEKSCEKCLSYPKGATPCLLGIEHKERTGIDVTEPTEMLVIEYANLSGRESANRAEFRKRAETILSQAIASSVEARERFISEAVKELLPTEQDIKDDGDNQKAIDSRTGWESALKCVLSIINPSKE